MIIRVQIQAHKKYCGWCHGHIDAAKQIIDDARRYRWCHIFARELGVEDGKPLRCKECLEGEV